MIIKPPERIAALYELAPVQPAKNSAGENLFLAPEAQPFYPAIPHCGNAFIVVGPGTRDTGTPNGVSVCDTWGPTFGGPTLGCELHVGIQF